MSNESQAVAAKVGSGAKISKIWIVPFIAVIIGLWMVYLNWASKGPLVEITFVRGDGIEAGKTKVKRKNVDVGEVRDLRLSEDGENVVLSVQMGKNYGNLLQEDSRFWVVRPRVGRGGISGLNTLLSGAYIELSPGSAEEFAVSFTGLDVPPLTPIGTPGLHVTLDSNGDKPLNEGDPILFHGMEVGTIEFVFFNSDERRTYYNAFIEAPYDKLITTNTRFWFSSGVSANLTADGIRLEMSSLSAVVSGGVSFDVPEGQPEGDRIEQRAFFNIYPNKSAINERQYEQSLSFIVLFENSVRGLRPGAPVEYRGVKVGQVLRTDIDYVEIENLLEPGSRIPVLIEIVPGRLGYSDSEAAMEDIDIEIDRLIAEGLQAGLATGSLVTGRKYVELRHDDQPGSAPQVFAGYTVIPSVDGQLGQLLANAERTLESINNLPLEEVAESARNAFDETALTLAEFRKSATELEEILADPENRQLIGILNATLDSFRNLALDFSEGSATNSEMQRGLQSLEQTLLELEPVLRNLRRKPNSLIFGGKDSADPEPEGVQE